MDLGELVETINERVDWLIAAMVALLVANLLVAGYLVYLYLSFENFHSQYGFEGKTDFSEERARLQDIPELEDIEVPAPPEPKPLPEKYVELEGTELFTSLPERMELNPELAPADNLGADTAAGDAEPQLPKVKGYEVIGRISDEDGEGVSIINNLDKGKTHVVKAGEFLGNSDIKVEQISDTQVRLNSPEHRVTSFQFEIDLISEKIQNSITEF